jgi:AraC-like DNA-binding protein
VAQPRRTLRHRWSKLPEGRARPRPRDAWKRRASLLSPEDRPALARHFLKLIREHSREACTVTEVTRVLAVSRSALERTCLRAFDFPPAVLINLSRVVSIARDLRETGQPLKTISIGHGFPTPSIMNRFFTRFVGIPPASYRGAGLALRAGDDAVSAARSCPT